MARKGKTTLNLAGLMINLWSSPRGREPRSTKGYNRDRKMSMQRWTIGESTVEKSQAAAELLKSVKQIRKGYTNIARANQSLAMPSIMFHSVSAF